MRNYERLITGAVHTCAWRTPTYPILHSFSESDKMLSPWVIIQCDQIQPGSSAHTVPNPLRPAANMTTHAHAASVLNYYFTILFT